MNAEHPRLFYAEPGWIGGETARLEGEEATHLTRVLRMRPGDRCRFATGAGAEYLVELTTVAKTRAEGRILERLPARPPAPLHIALGLPLIKGDRFEWVLEKGTELGVDAFHPLALARCEARVPKDKEAARLTRWRRIVREAAKQCDRVPPPAERAVSTLADFLDDTRDFGLKLFGHIGENALPLREALSGVSRSEAGLPLTVALLTGPEGDLAPGEAEAARGAGFLPVSLGPRILRADTAPLALTAIVQHVLGELA